jgi:pheromone shutdown protein TraB
MDEFDTAYYWKINVTDGNCTLEKIITFTTDTDAMNITFEATQFGVFLGFLLFALFFILGYFSKKRSGGFFLIFSGFTLIGVSIVASTYLTVYVSALMIPFAGFICLLGVKKAFYNDEADEKAQEKSRKR